MSRQDEDDSNPSEEADQADETKMVVKDNTADNEEISTESYACSESHADKGSKNPLKQLKGLLSRVKKKLRKEDQVDRSIKAEQNIDCPRPDPKSDTDTSTPASVTDQSVFEYDFSHAERGMAVLIIYTKFANENSDRSYAEADKVNMRNMFISLGFSVAVLENYPTRDLSKALKNISSTMKSDVDCFACVLSSHGIESLGKDRHRSHYIYTSDGAVETSSIVQQFGHESCWQLNGKPKLFFIQACRSKFAAKEGTENDPGVLIQVYRNGGLEERKIRFEQQPCINSSKMDAKHSVDEHFNIPFADDDVPSDNKETNGGSDGQYNLQIRQADLAYRKAMQQNNEMNQHQSNNSQQQHTTQQSTLRHIEDVEFFDVPCYDDCLVMFSSPPERVAWSDDYIGGWLPYCLFRVIEELDSENFLEDFLQVLTRVNGKMALEMETRFGKNSVYYRNKSVACIYHKLTKDIFLSKKRFSTQQPIPKVTSV